MPPFSDSRSENTQWLFASIVFLSAMQRVSFLDEKIVVINTQLRWGWVNLFIILKRFLRSSKSSSKRTKFGRCGFSKRWSRAGNIGGLCWVRRQTTHFSFPVGICWLFQIEVSKLSADLVCGRWLRLRCTHSRVLIESSLFKKGFTWRHDCCFRRLQMIFSPFSKFFRIFLNRRMRFNRHFLSLYRFMTLSLSRISKAR
jgi:hypothetical protein